MPVSNPVSPVQNRCEDDIIVGRTSFIVIDTLRRDTTIFSCTQIQGKESLRRSRRRLQRFVHCTLRHGGTFPGLNAPHFGICGRASVFGLETMLRSISSITLNNISARIRNAATSAVHVLVAELRDAHVAVERFSRDALARAATNQQLASTATSIKGLPKMKSGRAVKRRFRLHD